MHQPVIHVQHKQSGCLTAIIMLTVLGSIGASLGGAFLSLMPAWLTKETVDRVIQVTTASTGATRSDSAPLLPVAPPENLFNDPTPLPGKIKAALGGPVMIRELVIYETYAIFSAQNPNKKEHVDRYTYRNGAVGDSQPVSLGSDKKRLGQILLPLDSVVFSIIPGLAERARAELKIEDGKVSHIYVERDSPFNRGEPVIRVYVRGERDSGFVEYSLKGQKKRVAGP